MLVIAASRGRGFCDHRTPTRRRHADKVALWLQFPPSHHRRTSIRRHPSPTAPESHERWHRPARRQTAPEAPVSPGAPHRRATPTSGRGHAPGRSSRNARRCLQLVEVTFHRPNGYEGGHNAGTHAARSHSPLQTSSKRRYARGPIPPTVTNVVQTHARTAVSCPFGYRMDDVCNNRAGNRRKSNPDGRRL